MKEINKIKVSYNGKIHVWSDILEVAKKLGMNLKLAEDIAQQVRACVEDDLGEFIFKRWNIAKVKA